MHVFPKFEIWKISDFCPFEGWYSNSLFVGLQIFYLKQEHSLLYKYQKVPISSPSFISAQLHKKVHEKSYKGSKSLHSSWNTLYSGQTWHIIWFHEINKVLFQRLLPKITYNKIRASWKIHFVRGSPWPGQFRKEKRKEKIGLWPSKEACQ